MKRGADLILVAGIIALAAATTLTVAPAQIVQEEITRCLSIEDAGRRAACLNKARGSPVVQSPAPRSPGPRSAPVGVTPGNGVPTARQLDRAEMRRNARYGFATCLNEAMRIYIRMGMRDAGQLEAEALGLCKAQAYVLIRVMDGTPEEKTAELKLMTHEALAVLAVQAR